ncbi:MAG: MlaD family protein [Yoonia sp.]|uniref:MlaD family protein n=1 Tax=Yoonia sp. TaxID=2212373 RepID=UPI00273EC5C3|nr:MlaD family protein [Yoonia sp.]MDP5085586.1 MlaD family protein [Yoonia sp.]
METRANYILIGAFTLLAMIGTLGFFVWLASVQIDRQYATYGILFDDVSGLDPSGDVFFNGISVGRVIGIEIDSQDPSRVLTTVEISAATPVRSDTVAQLQSQGVTGVASISLSGGTPEAAPLVTERNGIPIIPSRRSTVQTLVEDAPDLIADAALLLEQLQGLVSEENRLHVTSLLRNLDTASGQLEQALSDFSAITGTVSDATAQIAEFTARMDNIGTAVEATLERTDAALLSAQGAFDAADRTLATTASAIDSAGSAFDQADLLMREQVPDILRQVSEGVAGLNTAVANIQQRSEQALDGFGETAQLLNMRLTELEQTLLDANTAFVAVTQASDGFDTLVNGDGALMVVEARDVLALAKTAIGNIDAVVIDQVPAILADIRAAVATAATAVDQVAADVTGLTGRFDPLAEETAQTLATANAFFAQAQGSLTTFDATLADASGALLSAETAFDSASDILETDLGPVLTDIRAASDRISVAVEDVTRDMPDITAELRALIARSDAVVAQVQTAVANSAPGISDFAQTGLPELNRLSIEARNLVSTLDSLARRIDRDPARFLLDDRVPEYRR